ncbi:hypothetical protein SEA_KROMP_12 [Streptomyces phage Kromp]|uniref:Uncharacterized protein n=1 Tax=Streptomyces phage Kromp TaxID=2315619 RepID=A0A386K8R9_9CAUD|nr:hypothetical protein SEA_KROMP_12 [Streptomyces phage Kromp]
MPTIRLAHWHGGQPPGSVVDVTAEDLALLKRDGRVAEVLPDRPEPKAAPEHAAAPAEEAAPEPEPAAAEPEAEAPAKSSRRRR